MSISLANSLLLIVMVCSCAGPARQVADEQSLRTHILDFWNDTDFRDADENSREQSLVDYLYLLRHADSITRNEGWTILHPILDNQPHRLVVEYLGDTESPLYSPAMLDEYLSSMVSCLPPHHSGRIRAEYLLDNIRKNRPGSLIADLRLITTSGHSTTLRHLIAGTDGVCRIVFYDPECESCRILTEHPDALEAGTDRVIAVSIVPQQLTLPCGWISASVADPQSLDDRYYLPSLPAIYVTDRDGTVIDKF